MDMPANRRDFKVILYGLRFSQGRTNVFYVSMVHSQKDNVLIVSDDKESLLLRKPKI